MNPPNLPRLALTLGEPAGIGVDLCIQLVQQPLPAHIVAVGSSDLLLSRAQQLGLPLTLTEFDPTLPAQAHSPGQLSVVDVPLKAPCVAGQLNAKNAPYVIALLERGVALCLDKHCEALVTAPVHKAIIHQSGFPFSGHTEFLKDLSQCEAVLMSFYTPDLILGLATTHCPLEEVSRVLTAEKLEKAIILLHQGLTQVFGRVDPKITVLGLNPHAGESGSIGQEEQKMMIPTLNSLKQQYGYRLQGPVSGDTAFTAANRKTDAILAMYHDQGLAPIKALYFGELVNVTLGLPFLRTSVDHGTALDLAGTTQADPTSLLRACEVAAQFAFSGE